MPIIIDHQLIEFNSMDEVPDLDSWILVFDVKFERYRVVKYRKDGQFEEDSGKLFRHPHTNYGVWAYLNFPMLIARSQNE